MSKFYIVDVPSMDRDHTHFFKLTQAIEDAEEYGADTLKILTELQAYALAHFELEEDMMRVAGYPNMSLHIEAHNAFIKEVREMKLDGTNEKLIADFTRRWLLSHIALTDADLGEYLKEYMHNANIIKELMK